MLSPSNMRFAAIMFFVLLLVALSVPAQAENNSLTFQESFQPVTAGPVVLVLSGASGPEFYRDYAAKLATLGYYSVLLDGRDILTREKDGLGNLQKAISEAQASKHAIPGKVAVIGFSQGGGGALLHAATLSEQVSMVVAYYPAVSWSSSMAWFAGRFEVPILVLAGERDRWNSCCLIESMRGLESAAVARKARFELVIYPQAEHGFNLSSGAFPGSYRAEDADDAWRRTTAMLIKFQPLQRSQ